MMFQTLLMHLLENRNIVTIALLSILVSFIIFRWHRFYSGTPPGPWGLPILGYCPFLKNDIPREFIKLSKTYGNIFSIQFGSRYIIVLNNYSVIKEAFVKNGINFEGRPVDGGDIEFGEHKMVPVIDGELWREQRRFLLSAMRDFGFGKIQIEENIQKEFKFAMETVLKTNGQSFDLKRITLSMTSNVTAWLLFGQRFNPEHKDITKALNALDEIVNSFNFLSIRNSFPILLKFIPRKSVLLNRVIVLRDFVYEFIDKLVDQHKKTYDENVMRDVIDVYLMKLNQSRINNPTNSGNEIYTRPFLRANLTALLMAGTDSTSTLMNWGLRILAAYPDMQRQAQKEIDDVIGRERFPTMGDRIKLPYTEAVLLEIMRYVSLVALSPYHRVTDEVMFCGYRIPKNTIVVANLWNMHYDPEIWDKPEEFNPNRFLGKDGKVTKLRDSVLPFGLGKRNCLGESLARMEFFLFMTAFLQNLSFTLPKDEIWCFKPDLILPMIISHNNNICAKPR